MLAWSGFRRRWGPWGGRAGGSGGGPRGAAGAGRSWTTGRKLAMTVAVLVLIATAASFIADAMLRPPLQAWASTRAINVATKAISTAVRDHVLADLRADALFSAMTDADGNVVLIDYDMVLLNKVRADVAHYIQQELSSVAHDELPLPLGLLTGIDVLAARGPRLPVRIVPVGAVTAIPKSDFRAAGINFVNHRLYIHVTVTMRVVAPYLDMTIPVEQEVVLSNQIVPGRVPNVYVGIEGIDLSQLQDGLLRMQSGFGR